MTAGRVDASWWRLTLVPKRADPAVQGEVAFRARMMRCRFVDALSLALQSTQLQGRQSNHGIPMFRRLYPCMSLLGIAASWCWCADTSVADPAAVDKRFVDLSSLGSTPTPQSVPLSYRFGGHLLLGLHPFSGTGPYHFEGLSSNPYYARYRDIEYGFRIGIDLEVTDALRFWLQFPYTANPTAMTPDPTGQIPMHTGYGHVDAAFGLEWTFP